MLLILRSNLLGSLPITLSDSEEPLLSVHQKARRSYLSGRNLPIRGRPRKALRRRMNRNRRVYRWRKLSAKAGYHHWAGRSISCFRYVGLVIPYSMCLHIAIAPLKWYMKKMRITDLYFHVVFFVRTTVFDHMLDNLRPTDVAHATSADQACSQ